MVVGAPPQSLVVSLGVAALVVWRVWRRVRRMASRQRLKPWRPWITLAIFPLLLALLAAGSVAQPDRLAALVAGTAVGSALGVYGLRRTRFESTPDGLFYTPSAHVGIALSLLFVGRVVYRLAQGWLLLQAGHAGPAGFVRSPLTLAVFGTMAGYYVVYAAGLVRWRRQVDPAGANA